MDLKAKFRQLPSVDKLLLDERIKKLSLVHEELVDVIRRRLAETRSAISQGGAVPSFDEVVTQVVAGASTLEHVSLRPVINATGTVLHTNLGRAPLSPEAIRAMELASCSYSNLEFDLDRGKRGSRLVHIDQLLCQLTGAEAATVVNNNASGVLLALSALAKRKEVIVSRGQAVEIGGGFRIPNVLRQSGAKMVEVGTTNRTYLADYEQEITPRTAALLSVHSSNFRIIGFTSDVSLEEMVELGRKYDLPVLDDLGSGCFINTANFGLDAEPKVQDCVALGASLVFFSGDKLLGGPQAGIVVGRKDLVEKLKKHPLARAVRIDKVRIAGLAATLVHYLRGEALEKIPILRMIAAPLDELEKRARKWASFLGKAATVTPGESTVGGGSLPESTMPTRLVSIKLKRARIHELAQNLRQHRPAIIGRVGQNSLLLDPRCVLPEEEDTLLEAVRDALAALGD